MNTLLNPEPIFGKGMCGKGMKCNHSAAVYSPAFLARLIFLSAICLSLIGCGSLDRTAFNSTRTAVSLADAGMTAYGNYYRAAWNSPEIYRTTTNRLAEQRKVLSALSYNVGITAELAETLRRAYRTNTAVKPQLVGALETLGQNASNIVWTVNLVLKP